MPKLSVRGLFGGTPREKKELNPEMRRLLNSYEPLHPETSADDEHPLDHAHASHDGEQQRSVA
jgi:hypothetical protein